MGSCLDPEFPGASPWEGVDARAGPPNLKAKSQLELSRDGGEMREVKEEPIQDVMQEDQRPTE